MRKPYKEMLCDFTVFYLFIVVPFCVVSAEEHADEAVVADSIEEGHDGDQVMKNPVEEAIVEFTIQTQQTIKKMALDDVPEETLINLVSQVEQIMNLMKDQSNVYKFIEAKGIDRAITPYLHIQHPELRTQLLKLTQLLFDVAPTTTSVMIPINTLDEILDIFEDEENLQLKARTMNILSAWLPDNPKVQARLMKVKGLEPFYDQAHKLDASIIQTQLKLFSKIIKEHVAARAVGAKIEPSKLNLYIHIGLMERLSSATICQGLFEILQMIWMYGEKNTGFMVPVFEILIDVYPYCTETLYGRTKVLKLIEDMHEHVKRIDGNAKSLYEQEGLNITNLELTLQNYVERIQIKDEL